MSMEALNAILGFSGTTVLILLGFATYWYRMRARQQVLSNRALEKKLERLEQISAENAQRLGDLETIIVSQTWNLLQEPGISEADRNRRLAAAGRREMFTPDAEGMDRQRAADLARRRVDESWRYGT